MRAILVLFLLAAALPVRAGEKPDDPRSPGTWMKEGMAAMIPKFKRVTFAMCPDDKSIAAVNCGERQGWEAGGLLVMHHTGDKVDWCAEFPAEFEETGAYVFSCEWRHLDRIGITVLEVYDSTHMGNGSLWLFALEGKRLRLLLNARAVDSHHEHSGAGLPGVLSSTVFEGGKLKADYPVLAGANYESVKLSGTVISYDDNDKELSRQSYQQTWKWDPAKKVFVKNDWL